MKVSEKVREGLKMEGYGRTAVSVRGCAGKGEEKIYVTVKDFYVPLKRIERIVTAIAPKICVVKFDYRGWNELVKGYVSTAQDIMSASEIMTAYENEFYSVVYRLITVSFALERKMGEEVQTIEVAVQAANAFELAESYYTLRARIVELTWIAAEEMAEHRKRGFLDIARTIKEQMQSRRQKVNATLKDLVLLLQCFMTGDYNLIYNSNLYKKHGAEYCEYLSILDEMKGELK